MLGKLIISFPPQAVTIFFVFLSMQLTALDLAAVDIGKGHNHGINLIGQGWFAYFFFFQFGRNAKVILGQQATVALFRSLKASKWKLHSAWFPEV